MFPLARLMMKFLIGLYQGGNSQVDQLEIVCHLSDGYHQMSGLLDAGMFKGGLSWD